MFEISIISAGTNAPFPLAVFSLWSCKFINSVDCNTVFRRTLNVVRNTIVKRPMNGLNIIMLINIIKYQKYLLSKFVLLPKLHLIIICNRIFNFYLISASYENLILITLYEHIWNGLSHYKLIIGTNDLTTTNVHKFLRSPNKDNIFVILCLDINLFLTILFHEKIYHSS